MGHYEEQPDPRLVQPSEEDQLRGLLEDIQAGETAIEDAWSTDHDITDPHGYSLSVQDDLRSCLRWRLAEDWEIENLKERARDAIQKIEDHLGKR